MASSDDILDQKNKPIALLIAILALCLAISETLGKNASSETLTANVESANLWAFFQAKTIRQTTLRTAAEQAELTLLGASEPAIREKIAAQLARWRATANRYESDPKDNDGRRELMARARAAEAKRDLASRKSDLFDMSSAALQIGIVMASAAIITGILGLAWFAGLFGIAGAVIIALGHYAPNAVGFI
jgi:hypothetical protein